MPRSTLKRCLSCPRLTTRTRCPDCEHPRKAMRNADRPIARAVVAASPVCSCTLDCRWHPGRVCSATEDLTADHVTAVANGGTNDGPRAVLCRRCNTRKRDRSIDG